MDKNPYDVLGVAYNASDAEIKKAYRKLSQKYHPDSYINNPLADLAKEKFQEVQEAYKQIQDERSHGGGSFAGDGGFGRASSSGGWGSRGSSGSGSSQGGSSAGMDDYSRAVNLINVRNFDAALNVLQGISERNAYWNYLMALCWAGKGNLAAAQQYAASASQMEPTNPEYRNLYNQLMTRGSSGGVGGESCTECCCNLWIADTLCECMGGDLCSCM